MVSDNKSKHFVLKNMLRFKNEDVKWFFGIFSKCVTLYFVLFLAELQKCIMDCPVSTVPVKCY